MLNGILRCVIVFDDASRLNYEEYVEFLRRTDLGSEYPKQNFRVRITKMLANSDICITARNEDGKLVGVCLALTDFAYLLFLTDLGVDRKFLRRGIGRELVKRAEDVAGGAADITITAIASKKALKFYKACKLHPSPELVVKFCEEWEPFVVR